MIQDMMPLFSVFLSCGYSSWGGPSHCDARSRTVSTKKNFAVREAEAGDSRKTPRDHSSCTFLSGTQEQLSIFCSSVPYFRNQGLEEHSETLSPGNARRIIQ